MKLLGDIFVGAAWFAMLVLIALVLHDAKVYGQVYSEQDVLNLEMDGMYELDRSSPVYDMWADEPTVNVYGEVEQPFIPRPQPNGFEQWGECVGFRDTLPVDWMEQCQ